MTEKNKSEKMTNASKPVPMKLFAAWEVDRTPSNCIPRLCTLRVTKLRVCGALSEAGSGAAGGAGAGAVILAARMHSSKRTLRSNDITIPPLDVELDLLFSLQYPHFVKRDGNRLQIMLQRRKKYKNRTILGYKTLAEGVIRMDQVLQRSMDMELELTAVGGKGGAGGGQPVARLCITGLQSTPVDHDTKNNNTLLIAERGYSDEEEEGEFSSVEEADEVTYGAPARRRAHRQLAFTKGDLSYTKQRNLKQKFAALLRRFRVPEEMGERGANRGTDHAQRDIDELFQELESLSCGEGEDSGPDTISIGSTPKPSLRPFFSSSRSLANQEHHRHSNESEAVRSSAGDERGSEGNSDGDVTADAPVSGASVSSSPPNDTKEDKRSRLFRSATSGGNLTPATGGRKKNSLVISTERPLSTHDMAHSPTALEPRRGVSEQISRLIGPEGSLPDCVGLAWGTAAVAALQALNVPTLIMTSMDVRAPLQALYARINKQQFRRPYLRVVVCGGEGAGGAAVRAHADVTARRAPSAPPAVYYIVPTGSTTISRFLAAADSGYAALFSGEAWTAACERAASAEIQDVVEMSARLARYLNSNGPISNVPIGEAMVAYRERAGDEDASQTFVPFIAEVQVGCLEAGACSLELDEGSPPATPAQDEPLELQLDYWLVPGRQAEGADGKVTVKASFRALHVTRHNAHLSVTYLTKEKKQKIMRLGKKKEKPGEAEVGRSQTVDGVARLICSAKGSHNPPLKVYIDGTEWTGVKFFQLSTQWQTHVKTFPVATCGAPLAPPEP